MNVKRKGRGKAIEINPKKKASTPIVHSASHAEIVMRRRKIEEQQQIKAEADEWEY